MPHGRSAQDPDGTLQKVLDFFGHHVRARLLSSFSACVVDFAFLQGVEKSEAFEEPCVVSMSQDVLSMSSKTTSYRVKLDLDTGQSGHVNLVEAVVCASSN